MASNFSKWSSDKQDPEAPLRVVLFTSRNKDNRGLPGFQERRRAFLYRMAFPSGIPPHLEREFGFFVKEGVPGEMSRLYVSVNARDPEKLTRELQHRLIDGNLTGGPNWMTHMDAVMASLAARKSCSAERKWMVDFDVDDEGEAERFAAYLRSLSSVEVAVHRTPHGYAILLSRGFDTRKLPAYPGYEKIRDNATIKKDGMLCAVWRTNE